MEFISRFAHKIIFRFITWIFQFVPLLEISRGLDEKSEPVSRLEILVRYYTIKLLSLINYKDLLYVPIKLFDIPTSLIEFAHLNNLVIVEASSLKEGMILFDNIKNTHEYGKRKMTGKLNKVIDCEIYNEISPGRISIFPLLLKYIEFPNTVSHVIKMNWRHINKTSNPTLLNVKTMGDDLLSESTTIYNHYELVGLSISDFIC